MIDIREVAKAIADLKIDDPASRAVAIHEHLRNYGTELLNCLAAAILPTHPGEAECVAWLRQEVQKVASQIPSPIQKKEPKK